VDLKIRPTSTNDQLEVISILSKAFNTPKSLPLNEDYINTQNIYSIVSEIDKKIVGTACLYILNKVNRKVGLIEDVAVLPSYKGKGIGLKLINHLLNIAKKRKVYKVILNSNKKNESFYHKAGFKTEQLQLVKRY
tara:strand:+ start:1418 stop:1822 length:405 start_codon:yes stop_codon:yes gene_type:complete